MHVVWKGLSLLWSLLLLLLRLPRYDLILIQNPPSIPAVIVAFAISLFNQSAIVLDWHNLGFSVYEEKLGQRHVLVHVSRFLERIVSCFASYHFCVSKALQQWLKDQFLVDSVVFYDRPASIFSSHSLQPAERHQLLTKLGFTENSLFPSNEITTDTIQTTINQFSAEVRNRTDSGRVALVISATSWTADEDFHLLLDSMLSLESFLEQSQQLAKAWEFNRILCVITGKGELKASFESEVSRLEKAGQLGKFVLLRTKWLEVEDYPKLMSCANIGISLHTSTSGLDLPMKVLDMFGSGVPVCAVAFPTLSELLQHEVNGMVFSNKNELTQQLIELLFNEENGKLRKLKESAGKIEHWDEQWKRVVRATLFPDKNKKLL